MTATAVSLLRDALQVDEEEIASRKRRAMLLLARTESYARTTPVKSIPAGASGYLRLAMLQTSGDVRPPAQLGSARGYPMTLDQQSELKPILHPAERAGKGATYLRERLFTLPTHSLVRARDIANLLDWLGTRELTADPGLSPAGAW